MNEKRIKKLAEEHSEYMKKMYYLIFLHAYKHGYEDRENKK